MNRRRSPRLRLSANDDLSIVSAELDVPSRVRDVSFAGFALETPSPIRVGANLRFRICVPGHSERLLTARAIYCRLDCAERYVSGWVAESTDGQHPMAAVIADLISPGGSEV
jgi:hypothetical protein